MRALLGVERGVSRVHCQHNIHPLSTFTHSFPHARPGFILLLFLHRGRKLNESAAVVPDNIIAVDMSSLYIP